MNPPYRARDRPPPVDMPWQKFTYIMKGMATFTYSGNDLISVTDAAGNVYTLTYSGTNLVGIKRSSSTIASYTYSGYQATKMTDSEA